MSCGLRIVKLLPFSPGPGFVAAEIFENPNCRSRVVERDYVGTNHGRVIQTPVDGPKDDTALFAVIAYLQL